MKGFSQKNVKYIRRWYSFYRKGLQGVAISNFEKRLPGIQSDLARQTLKDPYNFDFLTIREGMTKENCKKKISDFLLELGEGFAYVGKDYQSSLPTIEEIERKLKEMDNESIGGRLDGETGE